MRDRGRRVSAPASVATISADGASLRTKSGLSRNADSRYGRFMRDRGRRVCTPTGDGLPCELPALLSVPGILSALSCC
ncbi:hypothetical protein GCM10007857_90070 [Bradyrhizobium iriomotense]|uniref:Uncharacterized protein n=1 Tax=Bradyrhizobium iriomotense TaxID=441950 RepID=A0ABQ6BFQ9_9BRAD|nr:hypothetical protein GCM10007857_90070 [Bradyrhizobium iriomotense]